MTPDFVEREYNNRALVPDHPAYFERWQRDSAYVRANLPCVLDVPYGDHPLQRMDLFPVPRSRNTLVFIHGGYWRSLDKAMFDWLAASWVAAGVSFVSLNYRLCPEVRIDDTVDDVVAGMNRLFAEGARHGVSTERVVVSGHSAGGHLVAALFAVPRERLAFDPAAIVGGAPLSGVFDFEPIRLFSFNADFRLDAADVRRLSLLDKPPVIKAPLVVAAGGDESSEFRRQSRALADAWRGQMRALLLPPGLNHFSIVDGLAERGQPIYDATLKLFPA
jgi:arylformamidase